MLLVKTKTMSLRCLKSMPSQNGSDDTTKKITIVYSILCIAGLVANLMVVFVILLSKSLRTASNIHIVNLAVAYILFGINAIILLVDTLTGWTPDGQVCRFVGFMNLVPPIAVVLSMVLIAHNRYYCIVQASRHSLFKSKYKVALLALLVWIIAMIVGVPLLTETVHVKSGFVCSCCFFFSENQTYGISITVCVYILPNILIGFFYSKIFLHVHRSHRRVHHESSSREYFYKRTDVKVAIQFIIIFALFNVSYLPMIIVMWVDNATLPVPEALKAVVTIVFGLNMYVNPVVYFYFSRRARMEMFSLCICSRRQFDSHRSETSDGQTGSQKPPETAKEEHRKPEGANPPSPPMINLSTSDITPLEDAPRTQLAGQKRTNHENDFKGQQETQGQLNK